MTTKTITERVEEGWKPNDDLESELERERREYAEKATQEFYRKQREQNLLRSQRGMEVVDLTGTGTGTGTGDENCNPHHHHMEVEVIRLREDYHRHQKQQKQNLH
jgi:hypothetical protein